MSRPLTVLSVAYPFAPVGPDAVGGAEQILSHLDRALTAAGHRSIVVAATGSAVAGRLVPTDVPPGEFTDDVRAAVWAAHRANLIRTLDEHDIDVVHLHGIDFHQYLPPAGVAAVVTLHLPPGWYPPAVWSLDRPGTRLVCVSDHQRRACPAGVPLTTVPNGVDVDALRFRCRKRPFAVALGRVCPEKNFHVALDAGTGAGVAVLLGGRVFPYADHQRYYAEQVVPRLGRHRFLGPIGLRRKRRLLTAARCLLSASVAPETSSLVAMESLACGTPVVAFPSGAVPEIVDHGTTGLLVDDERQMADAIGAAARLDADACRDAARRRFSVAAMVDRYVDLYRQSIRTPPYSDGPEGRAFRPTHARPSGPSLNGAGVVA